MKKEIDVLKIKAIMQHYGLNQTDFSAKTGIPKTSVSKILSGERTCGENVANKILLAFDKINAAWLFEGTGQMLSRDNSHQTVSGDITVNGNGNSNIGHGNCNIPAQTRGCNRNCENCCDKGYRCPECGLKKGEVIVLDDVRKPEIPTEWAYSSDIDVFSEVMNNLDKVSRSRFIALDSPVEMWLPVRDDSLTPRAYRGDHLGLCFYPKGEEDPIWGKFHAIDTYSNGIIVRKLYPAEGGYRCVSPNEDYPEFIIKYEKIIRIARVVYVVRKAL